MKMWSLSPERRANCDRYETAKDTAVDATETVKDTAADVASKAYDFISSYLTWGEQNAKEAKTTTAQSIQVRQLSSQQSVLATLSYHRVHHLVPLIYSRRGWINSLMPNFYAQALTCTNKW